MNKLDFLTGRTTDQLMPFLGGPFLVHKEMNRSLENLFSKAALDGLDLAFSSTFRSYADQQKIWNNKAQGLRAVLDSDSRPVDISSKSKDEILFLILRWSAIPGGSRHHWGTDFDIYDRTRMEPGYQVQLIPSEYQDGGPFARANLWLSENMEQFDFFRPYASDRGGIAPEPWHLSYRPLSEDFLEQFSFASFEQHIEQSDFLLMDEVKENLAEIYQRFIQIS